MTKTATLLFVILCFLGLHLFSQNISTVSEIYDYEVGDVFHWEYEGSSQSEGYIKLSNIEILEKYYSTENDTVFYKRFIRQQESGSANPDPVIAEYTDTVYYTDLDALINNGNIDDIYQSPDLFNGRKINEVLIYADPETWNFSYIEGCGRMMYYTGGSLGQTSILDELIYFKKGDEIWGNPVYVSVESKEKEQLKLYPNPSDGVVTISSLFEKDSKLLVYNVTGRLVKTVSLVASAEQQVDLNELQTGVYLLQVNSKNKQFNTRLVVRK